MNMERSIYLESLCKEVKALIPVYEDEIDSIYDQAYMEDEDGYLVNEELYNRYKLLDRDIIPSLKNADEYIGKLLEQIEFLEEEFVLK